MNDDDDDLPDRRKHGYSELEGKLDTHTQQIESDVETFVSITGNRMRRVLIGSIIAISVIALATGAALFGFGLIVHYNHSQSEKVEKIAKRADKRSQRSAIQLEITREKVCSPSDRIDACRALFERLAVALSEGQRDRLACQVIRHLTGPEAESLRDETPRCDTRHKR